MKKVYFACSIAGGRDYAHLYVDLATYIKEAGAELLSEMFAEKELRPEVGMKLDPNFVWKRDVKWVSEADGIVAEVTQPSLGVGYELALAEKLNTPVLALFNTTSGRRLSPMVAGNPHMQVINYEEVTQIKSQIKSFIETL